MLSLGPSYNIANGINNSGQIVGRFGGANHSFLDTAGSITTIEVPGSAGGQP